MSKSTLKPITRFANRAKLRDVNVLNRTKEKLEKPERTHGRQRPGLRTGAAPRGTETKCTLQRAVKCVLAEAATLHRLGTTQTHRHTESSWKQNSSCSPHYKPLYHPYGLGDIYDRVGLTAVGSETLGTT